MKTVGWGFTFSLRPSVSGSLHSKKKAFAHCTLILSSLLACVLLGSPTAQAQYRTSIQGTVTDPSGAVVPDATVTLTNNETNQTLQSTTSSAGVFTFNALLPSTYTITVEKAGFQKQVLDHVQVIAEQANAVNDQSV